MAIERDFARWIRGVLNKAMLPTDDQTQANLLAAKQWLEAIAAGNLIVSAAKRGGVVGVPLVREGNGEKKDGTPDSGNHRTRVEVPSNGRDDGPQDE